MDRHACWGTQGGNDDHTDHTDHIDHDSFYHKNEDFPFLLEKERSLNLNCVVNR